MCLWMEENYKTKVFYMVIQFMAKLYFDISVDVIGVVKNCGEISTIIGKQSQKEITKRDLQIVDQSGMSVNVTLWGVDVSTSTNVVQVMFKLHHLTNRICEDAETGSIKKYLELLFSISSRLNNLMDQEIPSLLWKGPRYRIMEVRYLKQRKEAIVVHLDSLVQNCVCIT